MSPGGGEVARMRRFGFTPTPGLLLRGSRRYLHHLRGKHYEDGPGDKYPKHHLEESRRIFGQDGKLKQQEERRN